MQNEEQLDIETEKLIVDIQQAAWNSTTINQTKMYGNNYPEEIKELVAEKRITRRKLQQTIVEHRQTKIDLIT